MKGMQELGKIHHFSPIKYLGLIVLLFFSAPMHGQSRKHYVQLLKEVNNSSFPKVIVYDGPKIPISFQEYLKLGFSFINTYSLNNPQQVPNKYKYVLWTGIAFNHNDKNAPWAKNYSPFGNDLLKYENFWGNRLRLYYNAFNNPHDKNKFGLIVLDIEAKRHVSSLNSAPPSRQANDNRKEYNELYKIEMAHLYNKPLKYARSFFNHYSRWSSYADVPIERTWWNIPKKSWKEWTSKSDNLNYITHYRGNNGTINETDFYKSLDFLSVSSYYFYNPKYNNKVEANKYLAYMLFQLEVNQAWSKKPIYLYFTFRYNGKKEWNTYIDHNMVKNSVIFAFLSGADGMVLYDNKKVAISDSQYHQLLKTFVETISLLVPYKDYFMNKNVIYYKPDNPRDLFTNKKYIVRGIEKNGKLLIAATNPFAEKDQITNVSFFYKGKLIYIQLVGNETYLNELSLK